MPKRCSVCTHEKREEIDQALIRGDTYRSISQIYTISPDALSRHKKNGHIVKEVVESHQVEVIERSEDVWAQIDFWSGEIESIYQEAKQKQEKSLALTAIDKAMKLVALTAQIRATSGEGPVEVNPITLAGEVMEFLRERYPKAHKGLLEHLQELYKRYDSQVVKDDE